MTQIKRLLPSKRAGRAAVTNGTHLLRGVDHRSKAARRYRDLVDLYSRKFGTKEPELVKQLASLVTQREILDAQVVRGEKVDTLHLVRLAGAINRTLFQLKRTAADPDKVREQRRRNREDREAGLIA